MGRRNMENAGKLGLALTAGYWLHESPYMPDKSKPLPVKDAVDLSAPSPARVPPSLPAGFGRDELLAASLGLYRADRDESAFRGSTEAQSYAAGVLDGEFADPVHLCLLADAAKAIRSGKARELAAMARTMTHNGAVELIHRNLATRTDTAVTKPDTVRSVLNRLLKGPPREE
jgi:hypothetical protein